MQVFLFALREQAGSFVALAAQITGTAILISVLFPSLAGQIRGMHAPTGPRPISTGPRFGAPLSVTRGTVGSFPLGRRPVLAQRFPFRHQMRFNRFLANACFTDPFFDPFLCRRSFFRNAIFFSQPVVLPYPIYVGQPYVADQQASPVEQEQENELTRRIDRLTDQVERVREQQQSAESRKPVLQRHQAAEAKEPTRILVFRDGSRRVIANYALVGSTIWVLSEERAEKISVSELDMQATKDINTDRGVEFP